MEENFNKIEIFTCPTCRGIGLVKNKKCHTCRGCKITGLLFGNNLFWDKEFSLEDIILSKTKIILNFVIRGLMILFSLLGVYSLYLVLNRISGLSGLMDMFNQKSGLLLVFWLSVLVDLYLYYFWQKKSKRQRVIKKEYFTAGYSKKEAIDVADALDLEARKILENSWRVAKKFKHKEVLPIHLLVSLLDVQSIRIVFSRLGIGSDKMHSRIKNILGRQEKSKAEPKISQLVIKLFYQAYFLAFTDRVSRITVKEILLATACMENQVQELFYDLAITPEKLKNVVAWLGINQELVKRTRSFKGRAIFKPKGRMDRAYTAVATPLLDQYSQDLTALARAGYLPMCVARDQEIELIFQGMASGNSSVVLVGPPGVGKTAIIEGIAQLMVTEDVPTVLQDKRLISLSVSRLVAGASAEGQLEQRLLKMLNEIKRAGNIVLFVDDIHDLAGLSSSSSRSVDLAQIMADALSSHYFFVLGSSGSLEYTRYLERSSLGQVLQKIEIRETDQNQSIKILAAKIGAIEFKNKVYFSYNALEKTVEFSRRYIHEKYLPEKAIEILEEAALYSRNKKGENCVVMANEIAELISQKTKIKVAQVTTDEKEKLLNLESRIQERIVGQEEAVKLVASALRRARAELRDQKRPITNLLFLGPTGVGKTELTKTVAEVYFGSEDMMLRFDMSEFQNKKDIDRLIGAGESLGVLTEAVRKNPFSLVLLDEIEKAHPDILNLFLQVMDDGRLTSATGQTIDFSNVILIATSNAGTAYVQEQLKKGTPLGQIKNYLMEEGLQICFRPEFLNRFDGVVLFEPLSMESIVSIAKLLLQKVSRRLASKGINFSASEEAIRELAELGYDPKFGARPLRRVIQEKIDSALADYLLRGEIGRRDIAVLESGGKVRVEKAKEI